MADVDTASVRSGAAAAAASVLGWLKTRDVDRRPERTCPSPPAATANTAILALVVALRDVERRRAASNMSGDGVTTRTTA